MAATTRFKLAPYSSTGRRPIVRRRSRTLGAIRTLNISLHDGNEIDRFSTPDSTKARTSLVHVRGFEPPKPRRVAVLRTAAANRICLTCTSLAERAWIRTRDTRRCSRFQGECHKPDSAISPNWRKRSESNAHIPKDGPLRTGWAHQMPSASKTTWR